MLIVVFILAALIGTAFAAALLWPFWKSMRRALRGSLIDDHVGSPSAKATKGELIFNIVVVSGAISLVMGLTGLAVFSIRAPVTIFFLTWSVIGFLTWAILGRKY